MVTIEWVLDSWRDSLLVDLHGYIKVRHDAHQRMAGMRPALGRDRVYWLGVADVAQARIADIREWLDHVDFLRRESRYIRQLQHIRLHQSRLQWRHLKKKNRRGSSPAGF